MQKKSFRIWTQVNVFICYDDKHYSMSASINPQMATFKYLVKSVTFLWYNKKQNDEEHAISFQTFSNGHFYWEYTHENLVPFEVYSSGCNALGAPFQQLLERVNDIRHSLFHLLNCLITAASTILNFKKVWKLIVSTS